MLPVRCRFTDKCWNIYERRWMANSNNSLSQGNWPLKKKKRWAWNLWTFSAWSVKHGNSEGNSVSVKLGFALESKRKKLWPTRARAITINRFYTASPNQTQSRSFSTFLWLQMIPKNHKTGICNCWVVELHVLHAGILDDSSIVPVSWVCTRDIA